MRLAVHLWNAITTTRSLETHRDCIQAACVHARAVDLNVVQRQLHPRVHACNSADLKGVL